MDRTRPTGVIAPLATLAAFAAALAIAPAALAQAPSFTLMGWPSDFGPNGVSHVTGLSADGRSASGYSGGIGQPGFWWTADGGRNDFGRAAGLPTLTYGFGISGDGLTVVGRGDGATTTRAYAWSQAGGYRELGTLAGYLYTEARDANFDGSVIVGNASNGGTPQAFRWTASGGMQGLGVGMTAQAISSDGSTIVGNVGSATNGFRWTQAGGIQLLPSLGGAGTASVWGMNSDGTIIVGNSGVNVRATKWVNNVPTDLELGDASGISFHAQAVSDDGMVVAGLGQGLTDVGAVVWTPTTGIVRLSDYLTANGVSIPAGFSLAECTAVSADGKSFAGWGGGEGFNIDGFVATIPAPGACTVFALAGLIATRRRR